MQGISLILVILGSPSSKIAAVVGAFFRKFPEIRNGELLFENREIFGNIRQAMSPIRVRQIAGPLAASGRRSLHCFISVIVGVSRDNLLASPPRPLQDSRYILLSALPSSGNSERHGETRWERSGFVMLVKGRNGGYLPRAMILEDYRCRSSSKFSRSYYF